MSKPILHFILGSDPPPWATQHAETWKHYAEVLPWTWDTIEEEIGEPFARFREQITDPRLLANYARHWLIAHRGGSYADWDTEPVSDPYRLEEWGDSFVCAPHPRMIPRVDNSFLYARDPGHPFALKIMEEMDFTRLLSKQLTPLVHRDKSALRLDLAWNRDRQHKDAIIYHYYTGASLNRMEMDWLIPRIRGKRMAEAGSGLRSIELAKVCDLISLEHQPLFADRCRRGGCEVILEQNLHVYPVRFAEAARGAECVLIDGRRRNFCFEEVAKVNPGVTVYLHDSKRERYRLPEGWRVVDECAESMRGLIECRRV